MPWADVLYGSDFGWWERYGGVPQFKGLKLCQEDKIVDRPMWGVRRIIVRRLEDRLLTEHFGVIGWGGNSGFGALNLAIQFGAPRVVLVGFDMRLEGGLHWHGAHPDGLRNPEQFYVDRWREVIDGAAPTLERLGVTVLNASPVSALHNYRKVNFKEAIDGSEESAAAAPIKRPVRQAKHAEPRYPAGAAAGA